MFTLVKIIVSAIIIGIVTEVAKRYPTFGGIIAALPLVSLLSLFWLYFQGEQTQNLSKFITAVDYPKLGILLPYIRAYSNKTAAISDFHSRGSCPEKKRRTNERKVRDEVVRFSVR